MQNKIKQYFLGSKLRNRVLLYFIILAAAPILVLGGTVLDSITLSHQQDVSNLELQLIDQKIEEIEKFLTDTLGILELRVGYTQKAEIEYSQQEFLLEGLLEENKAFEETAFISLSGFETAKKSRTQNNVELADVSRLARFLEPTSGQNYIGNTYYTLSGPFITLAAPVHNRNGEIIQILSAEVNLLTLMRSIEMAKLGSSGYIVILDKNGIIMTDNSNSTITRGTNLAYYSRTDRVLKGTILSGLARNDRYVSYISSLPVIGAAKQIPETGWAIMAEWPITEADAMMNDVRNQIISFILVSMFIVLLLAPFFADRIVKPIRELTKGAAAIEKGRFRKRVNIKTNDELEELGHAFNKMAKGLKQLQALKDEFVFVAAHELRTPVTAVKGYVDMMLEGSYGKINNEMRESLQLTYDSAVRLNSLVNDLLEVSRSEAGRINIKIKPIDIKQAIKVTLDELKPLAKEKKISLNYKPMSRLPQVMADTDRVREIMINLVGNSIKYTNTGGAVRITHEIKSNRLITHIKDNGFGMSKEAQKKLFSKFYRVQTDKTAEIEGTGLGLFIVKQIIKKMRGKIWVKSVEGKGSTFSYSLLLAKT